MWVLLDFGHKMNCPEHTIQPTNQPLVVSDYDGDGENVLYKEGMNPRTQSLHRVIEKVDQEDTLHVVRVQEEGGEIERFFI